jgi:hypothetical protein
MCTTHSFHLPSYGRNTKHTILTPQYVMRPRRLRHIGPDFSMATESHTSQLKRHSRRLTATNVNAKVIHNNTKSNQYFYEN